MIIIKEVLMMKKQNLLVISIVAIILIAVITMFSVQKEDDQVIEVGFIGPLTGDGAIFGDPISLVVEIALEKINDSKFKVIYADGKCSAQEALTEAKRLIDLNNLRILLGGVCTEETLGIAPYVEERKVILFSPTSASPKVTLAGDYVFRSYPSEGVAGEQVARRAIFDGYKKIIVLHDQTEYSIESLKPFVRTFKDLGGEIVLNEGFSDQETDFNTILSKVKSTDVKAIYIMIETPATLDRLVSDMITLGGFQDFKIYADDVIISGDILENYGSFFEGAIFSKPVVNLEDENVSLFLEEFVKRYGSIPFPELYLISTYDAVNILHQVTGICGENTECIKKELYSSKFKGLMGEVSFDENGDVKYEYALYKISNRTAVLLE